MYSFNLLMEAIEFIDSPNHSVAFEKDSVHIANGTGGIVTVHVGVYALLKAAVELNDSVITAEYEKGIVSDGDEKHELDLNHPDAVQYEDNPYLEEFIKLSKLGETEMREEFKEKTRPFVQAYLDYLSTIDRVTSTLFKREMFNDGYDVTNLKHEDIYCA